MRHTSKRLSLAAAAVTLTLPALACAHPGADGGAHHAPFVAGLVHPFTGVDHLAAMLSVGVFGALSGRQVWRAPLAFAACLLLGSGFLARRRSALRLGGAVLTSSVAFFVLSNFGMWASGYYPRTLAGLVECYVAALPFFRNTLTSDVLYSAVLFGGYALIARLMERRKIGRAHV